jgi:hypothetical protein
MPNTAPISEFGGEFSGEKVCAHASDCRGGDDLVLQAQGGLVHKARHHAELNVFEGHQLHG